jgi:uncharacterized membrane protein (UPF0127 family)
MSDLISYLPIDGAFVKQAITEDEQELLLQLWEDKFSSIDARNYKIQSLIQKGYLEKTNLLGKFDVSKKGKNFIKSYILSNETSALEKKASLIKTASLNKNENQIIITAEVADTPAALAHGLMFKKHLDKNAGMVFKFSSLTEAAFWGKNTYIPLDVAFIQDNKIIDIKSITPMSTKLIRSNGYCDMAIEVNAGFFEKNNIKIGSLIEMEEAETGVKILFKSI